MQIQDLDKFISENPSLKGEPIVLEKTENSELISVAKPCNRDFFERLFSPQGPFWEVYSELGFGEKPIGFAHLAFVNERMYFCRNVERKFIYSLGPRKKLSFRNGKISGQFSFSFDNFLLSLSTPFDFARQVSSAALANLRVNEELENFLLFSREANAFWEKNRNAKIENHSLLAEKCLEGALNAMKFSFFSSMAYSLKIRLKDSESWKDCELENLSEACSEKTFNFGEIREKFGFYSQNPYDISKPYFCEYPDAAASCRSIKFPREPAARWRENCKFLCARYLCLERKCYLDFSEKTKLYENAFFLRSNELSLPKEKLSPIAGERRKKFEEMLEKDLPKTLVFYKSWHFGLSEESKELSGISAGGLSAVQGKAVFINSEADYKKDVAGKIIVSKTLSPNLTLFFGSARGIVSEGGGKVSHAAIIALEQNIPCIVQVKNFGQIKEGDLIRLEPLKGQIEKISN